MTQNNYQPDEFEKKLILEYFKFGSIEKVFSENKYDLPVSFATYHRILNKFGIIKSAGPNSRLSESLDFLTMLNAYKVPLEKVYQRYAPPSMKVSTNTLHRILHHVRLGVTRRVGTALLVSEEGVEDKYLLAQDQSLLNSSLGNKGDWSLPMGHSRMQDDSRIGIKRVAQQELFTDLCLNGAFPDNLFSKKINPIIYINIADIKVSVFRITIPSTYCHFSSLKLKNYHYFSQKEIKGLRLRPGVGEIINQYEKQRFYPSQSKTVVLNSDLNLALIQNQVSCNS